MSWLGEVGDVVETGRGDGTFFCEWRIPDFLSLAGKGGDRYGSPEFDACGGRWFFMIYPKGLPGFAPSEFVTFVLWRLDVGPPQTFDVTLGIRGAEGVENKKGRRQEFSGDDFTCHWNTFCSRLKLEQNSRLMPGNMLILSLDLKSAVPSVAKDYIEASIQTNEDSKKAEVPTEENQCTEKQGIEKVVEDIGKLLISGENSDVTVQVLDVEFKTHRAILSARCPVLSAMFKHETEEKVTNRITISDCEPEVFGDFLHYLYKGSARHLSEKNVFSLYRVADKYLADDLKQQCLQHIRDTLSVQTFCDTVQLALTHGQSGLLEQATDFATKNI